MKWTSARALLSLRCLLGLLGLQLAAGRLGVAAAEEYQARVFTNAAGLTLPYRLLVPKDYDAKQAYPLVIFLHGAGERGTDNAAQLIHGTGLFAKPEVRERFPCFVLAPQCPPNQSWAGRRRDGNETSRPAQPATPMQLTLELADALGQEFRIDTNRLYLTGLSMGGYGAWDCITRDPARFAAAAPICGGGDPKAVTPAVAKVPVWAFHAENDPAVKVEQTRAMVRALREAGGQPKYFEYFGLGHNSWGQAYSEPELLSWMFAQRRGQPDTYALKTPIPEPPPVARFPDDSAFPGQGPIRKWDWFRNLWCERRLAWWNSREKDRGAVVFLGDSITQGWDSLPKDFPDFKVANRGISGDLTRGVLYRLKEDVLDLDPRAVVLLIGTNDLEDHGEPEIIAENVRAVLAACKARHPTMPVIVCKVMPSQASKNRPADKIRKLNSLVDDLMKADPQLIRCDSWSIFANDQGDAKPEDFPDQLHPNAAGYAKWAEALRPIFAKLNLVKASQ